MPIAVKRLAWQVRVGRLAIYTGLESARLIEFQRLEKSAAR